MCWFVTVNKIHNLNAYMEAVCLCIDLFLFPLLTIVYTKMNYCQYCIRVPLTVLFFCCIWFYLFCSLLPLEMLCKYFIGFVYFTSSVL